MKPVNRVRCSLLLGVAVMWTLSAAVYTGSMFFSKEPWYWGSGVMFGMGVMFLIWIDKPMLCWACRKE